MVEVDYIRATNVARLMLAKEAIRSLSEDDAIGLTTEEINALLAKLREWETQTFNLIEEATDDQR